MPNLTFVLPHWLYWAGLLLFPLGAMYIIRRNIGKKTEGIISLPIAYFLLITGGFVGLHRFYLKNLLGFIFIPIFLGILFTNVEIREARNLISKADNDLKSAVFMIEHHQNSLANGEITESDAAPLIESAQQEETTARAAVETARLNAEQWDMTVKFLAALTLLLLAIDAYLLPGLTRRRAEKEKNIKKEIVYVDVPCDVDTGVAPADDTVQAMQNRFTRTVDRVNEFTGNFVAYWSMIAVIVYYYEVIARYVFNSPTNWAHESMFLMFGMQYLFAGGYVLKNNGHVRVDVIYTQFTPRRKAATDIVTSIFFFIFTLTLIGSGWVFFHDSFQVWEVSFTEWGIQYWPVKLAIPLGALLLLLQGVSWLLKDIALLRQKTGA
ncbi:MAG: hypothetical protein AMS22_04890 [Thiotrichales bacterium SG8_50]|nr:MAG: hypothetical protein AMS22_04890 [Thiotrichales bacterium SG8_50]